MFNTVLIANRGEIALRIQRACRTLGLRTVAAHSEADRDAIHVRNADIAVCIGPAPAARSYLDAAAILLAAAATGAEAIHPGYGFLAEGEVEVTADEGYRFLEPGEVFEFGDEEFTTDTWSPVSAEFVGEEVVLDEPLFRRRDPGEGYRFLEPGETVQAGDEARPSGEPR